MIKDLEGMLSEKKVYSAKEVSQFLKVDIKVIYSQCRKKKIPHLRLGRRVIFPIPQFNRWFNGESNAR